jgi:hypothetical protein
MPAWIKRVLADEFNEQAKACRRSGKAVCFDALEHLD